MFFRKSSDKHMRFHVGAQARCTPAVAIGGGSLQQQICCTHEQLNSGIHIFRVVRANRASVDQYLMKLEQLFHEHPQGQPFRFIVDVRPAGMPSFAYTMQQSREVLKRVRQNNTLPSNIRVVYLHHNSPIMHTMDVFLLAMRIRSSRLILNGDHEDAAIAWLLSDQSAREFQLGEEDKH